MGEHHPPDTPQRRANRLDPEAAAMLVDVAADFGVTSSIST